MIKITGGSTQHIRIGGGGGIQLFGPAGLAYLLYDAFATARAAGAVNGTVSESPFPTGGGVVRTVTDTESKLSIAGGVLTFAGGKASPAVGDPGIWYPAQTRTAGKVLLAKIIPAVIDQYGPYIGWDTNQSGTPGADALGMTVGGVLYNYTGGATGAALGFYTTAGIQTAIVLRAAGAFFLVKDVSNLWLLLFATSVNTSSSLYPYLSIYNAVFTADNIRIPVATWLPTPLASDGFSLAGSTDGLGHAEQNGGAGLTWTGATWTVAAGAVTNSPTLGSELVTNGDMSSASGWTVGTGWVISGGQATATAASQSLDQNGILAIGQWYIGSFELVSRTSGNVGMLIGNGDTFSSKSSPGIYTRAARCSVSTNVVMTYSVIPTLVIDNVSTKLLTLSTLFRSLTVSTPDVLAEAAVTLTAGTQAGLVLNLDDAATPANFVIAYHNGVNVLLDKCVAGVYTNLISAAATYSAGAVLRVITSTSGGSLKVRVYYNGIFIGTEQTVSDAGIISNVKHGLFSTYASNTFDAYTLFARGTGNEYSALDAY